MAKKESEENKDIIKFRDRIFSLRTRRFGTVAEIMVKKLYNLDDSDEVEKIDGYSNKQHRGNIGEGQFHITNSNIKKHRKQHLKDTLSYEELYKLLEQK